MADNIEQGSPEPTPLTDIEQRASEQGWRPKDEWEGDPNDWRTAREFMDRGEFFKKIEDQNRTIKELRKTQQDLTKHLEVVRKTEYKRALESLKVQKRIALAEGDTDKVVELDDEIAETRAEMQRQPEPQPVVEVDPSLHPTFRAWVERNPWYESSEAMRAYADRVGSKIQGSPSEVLAEVERLVKKEFAHRFNNPRREAAPAVEGGNAKPAGKKDDFKLSDEERRVMQRFVRSGAISEEQYIKDLKEAKARGL